VTGFGAPKFNPANRGFVEGAAVAAGLLRFRPPNIVEPELPEVFNYDGYY